MRSGCRYSADGTDIAFVYGGSAHEDIWMVDAGGEDPVPVPIITA